MAVYMWTFAILPVVIPLAGFVVLCVFGQEPIIIVNRVGLYLAGIVTMVTLIIYPIFKRGDKKKRKNIR